MAVLALEWAVASAPLPGEPVSGDMYIVQPFQGGTLVAVVDGLGHGAEAAQASRIAVDCLKSYNREPIMALVQQCHQCLKRTRGVVLSVAIFDAAGATMTWLGIGDVEGVLVRANPQANPQREGIAARGGVLGFQLPYLRAGIISLAPGDLLVLATDGVKSEFSEGLRVTGSLQELADAILARYGKGTDDALVLVARLRGN